MTNSKFRDEPPVFVGSTRPGKKVLHFHKPDCHWAEYIRAPYLIEFFSHEEAEEAGYKPCKTCKA